MDLLRIDNRMVNLDRLCMIVEIEEDLPGPRKSRKVQLVMGDTTITLDEEQSDQFLAFIQGNFRVRDVGAITGQWAAGQRIHETPEANPGVLRDQPGS